MPQNFSDLGLSSDKILSITRTSGNGSAGSLDTYTIKTRANPNGTGFTFTVQNGTDGTSSNVIVHEVDGSVTSTSALVTYINNNYASIGFSSASEAYEHLVGALLKISGQATEYHTYTNSLIVSLDKILEGGIGPASYRYSIGCLIATPPSMDLISVDTYISQADYTELHFVLLFAQDPVEVQLDSKVNRSSANAVENRAIGQAISIGVDYYYTFSGGTKTAQSLPNAGQSYYPDLNQYVATGLPFYDNYGERHPVYKFVGHGIEVVTQEPQQTADCTQFVSATLDLNSDNFIAEFVTFNYALNQVVRKVTVTQATNDEIDALFPVE